MAIYVDCTKQGPPELMQKYGVRGYPTVIFTDPTGKQVGTLGGRDAASAKSQIEGVIKQHAKPTFAAVTLDEGAKAAREGGKLLGVMFVDPTMEGFPQFVEGLMDDPKLEELRKKFHWIQRPLRDGKKPSDEAKSLKASKAPFLVLIDPREGDLTKQVVGVSGSPRGLEGVLKKALDKAAKAKEKAAKSDGEGESAGE